MNSPALKPSGIMVIYWGRRGLTELAVRIAEGAIDAAAGSRVILSLSKQNDELNRLSSDKVTLHTVDLFKSDFGAIGRLWRLPILLREVREFVKANDIGLVIDVMPHIWALPVYRALRRVGVRVASLAHDDVRHPGDPLAIVRQLADQALASADVVVTLSRSVAKRVAELRPGLRSKLLPLFHPLTHDSKAPRRERTGDTLRILFLGRVLPYKGLDLFLDAADLVRANGNPLEIGVFGEGPIGPYLERMSRLEAESVNRWMSDEEIRTVLAEYDVLVASHRQGSQSGVVAAAQGAGLPCIVTPVGGLVEQVDHGETGLIAEETSASALAHAIEKLFSDPQLLAKMKSNLSARIEARSPHRFVGQIIQAI